MTETRGYDSCKVCAMPIEQTREGWTHVFKDVFLEHSNHKAAPCGTNVLISIDFVSTCEICGNRAWFFENRWYHSPDWNGNDLHYVRPTIDNYGGSPVTEEKTNENDPVNHPKHYTSDPSGVECIEITRHRNFNVGNAMKYLWRAGLKDLEGDALKAEIQDLKKAIWYINDEIKRLEK